MSLSVDIQRRMVSPQRSFDLRVRFETSARRTVIFGPSGAGKSLTLRAIAGLLKPDQGRIRLGDAVLFDSRLGIAQPARRRHLGYVFQDYALFPHLSVRQNVAFGLRQGWLNPSREARDDRVERSLKALELSELAGQYPDELSGGQRQRVALARALINSPRALLLDEPFSALDGDLRARMRDELDALLARLEIPVLMITHDREDLARFGEVVVHLAGGSLVAGSTDPRVEEN
jgi:molybdate transport system ATP-binding protein